MMSIGKKKKKLEAERQLMEEEERLKKVEE